VTISFATPDDQFSPTSVTLPAIDLFLYDVRENFDMRSNYWVEERQSNDTTTEKCPAARLKCSYPVTALPSRSVPHQSLNEPEPLLPSIAPRASRTVCFCDVFARMRHSVRFHIR